MSASTAHNVEANTEEEFKLEPVEDNGIKLSDDNAVIHQVYVMM